MNVKNFLIPKMCDPLLATILKVQPHYSQTSRDISTPSSGTSPLAPYKEVSPPPSGAAEQGVVFEGFINRVYNFTIWNLEQGVFLAWTRSLAKCLNFGRLQSILRDPGADSGDEGKSKWAEKCGAKKGKERRVSSVRSVGQSYQFTKSSLLPLPAVFPYSNPASKLIFSCDNVRLLCPLHKKLPHSQT